ELLKFPKTLPPAPSCLIYVSNALEAAQKVTAQVKVKYFDDLQDYMRRIARDSRGGMFEISGSPYLQV
ncbi:hypothetical protein PENTCL1PPCAC_7994, partial [Pristionchus entomophagus]